MLRLNDDCCGIMDNACFYYGPCTSIRTDSKIKGGFVTFLSHAKKWTIQVKFSSLLLTFWCHGDFQYLSFLFKKKHCF